MVCKKGGLSPLSGERLGFSLSSLAGERLDFSTVDEAQGAKIAFTGGGAWLPFPFGWRRLSRGSSSFPLCLEALSLLDPACWDLSYSALRSEVSLRAVSMWAACAFSSSVFLSLRISALSPSLEVRGGERSRCRERVRDLLSCFFSGDLPLVDLPRRCFTRDGVLFLLSARSELEDLSARCFAIAHGEFGGRNRERGGLGQQGAEQ